MFLETINLLVKAGTEALLSTCHLTVRQVSISQVRRGQITFPALAQVDFQGGTLQSARLGGDTLFSGHLAEIVDDVNHQSGVEKLAESFLKHAVKEMPERNPRGTIARLDVGPSTVYTRGNRSFGIKFVTDLGQMFLLVEVPSKLELELAKGSEFLPGMVSTYLPGNWLSRQELTSKGEIDSFLVFMRKAEADVNLEFALDTGQIDTRYGLLVEQCAWEDQRALRINQNLEYGPLAKLAKGEVVTTFVGLSDRSLEMDLEFLGTEQYRLPCGAELSTALFAIPEIIRVAQRRRAFRIDLVSSLPVELEAVDEDCTSTMWFGDETLGSGTAGHLVDLSFSGARIIGGENLCASFPENSRIRVRIFFPDAPQPLQVLGLVRRASSKLVDRESYQDELGVEFLITPEIDRNSMEAIRQYVLQEQRSQLARRVHVSGNV